MDFASELYDKQNLVYEGVLDGLLAKKAGTSGYYNNSYYLAGYNLGSNTRKERQLVEQKLDSNIKSILDNPIY